MHLSNDGALVVGAGRVAS